MANDESMEATMEAMEEAIEDFENDLKPVDTFFKEADEVHAAIKQLLATSLEFEGDKDKFMKTWVIVSPLNKTLSRYQMMPQLLDSHLEAMIKPVIAHIREYYFPDPSRLDDALFLFLRAVANVRGPKKIIKFFSHEVSDLEGVLRLLNSVNRKDMMAWSMRYVLLLWLSFVVMIPFPITRLDKGDFEQDVVTRVLDAAKSFLNYSGKERDAAAVLVGRLISRVDVAPTQMPLFAAWVDEQLSGEQSDLFKITGIMQALSYVLGHTDRNLILPHIDSFIALLRFAEMPNVKSNSLLRKLIMKVTQRIGMVLLKQKIPKWRYSRGMRSLQKNVQGANDMEVDSGVEESEEDEDEEDEVPEEIEQILHVLLNGLRDKDTIVRWSAAKGVGRITYRLPKELAEEVCISILDLFNENVVIENGQFDLAGVADVTWHGACLALAELARRGLLLPEQLPQAISWMELALSFDIRRGNFSIGSHVRDAACYVCWSFARAYAPHIMKPHVHSLAPSLVCVSLYDREVNVRRAASAAFQENVGRQGIFPHGIDIVTAADFFAVGNRTNSFLVAAKQVAAFEEYHPYCVQYLMKNSVTHWDIDVRNVAAQAMGVLIELQPTEFPRIFDELVSKISDKDLNVRHGAMIALAEIMQAARDQVAPDHVATIVAGIQAIPSVWMTTFGSETTRAGVARLVEALGQVTNLDEPTASALLTILESSLKRKEEPLQAETARATAAIVRHFDRDRLAACLHHWAKMVRPTGEAFTRRGFALALGAAPLLEGDEELVAFTARTLIAATEQPTKPSIDAETKRNALQALGQVLERYGTALGESENGTAVLAESVACMLTALDDYTTTIRGDVGSWVRMAAMQALVKTADASLSVIDPAALAAMVTGFVHQGMSRIDRVREVAGASITQVLAIVARSESAVETVPQFDVLQARVTEAGGAEIMWNLPTLAFEILGPLMAYDAYRRAVLLGFVLCMGGKTESLVLTSSKAIMDWLEGEDEVMDAATRVDVVTAELQGVLVEYAKQNRVIMPVLEALDILYTNQCLMFANDEFHEQVFKDVKTEVARIKDVPKILAALKIYGSLAGIPATHVKAMRHLILQTCHTYPRVRKAAAETLVNAVPMYVQVREEIGDPLSAEATAAVDQLLAEIDWTSPVDEVRVHKDALIEHLQAVVVAAE
ncbi:hypothetical protein AMAG_14573 [Allomyces macrogynus ATCC 38327]|uniref:Uncharacterized protein n=1 Tax=Allomyces macrogynus (strain ATCC 38327) TaxID=578462 RepID=A0A0L0T6L6_ALLM3|nr:hypothetical protein AMAG_14573 [Allomyces macrogynus ATCC 38327]|eukprot:KNE70443.1 hypothetical protein AMAG_14573 [Allomyces macrogynus ATCC 38327]